MRWIVKVVVAVLTMMMLYGVLFPGPAYAARRGKRTDVTLAGAGAAPAVAASKASESAGEPAPTTAAAAATPGGETKAAAPAAAAPPPKPPVIGSDISTTDQCFTKYSSQCEVQSCLLTLERETPEMIQDAFAQCKAQGQPDGTPSGATAAAAPPAQ